MAVSKDESLQKALMDAAASLNPESQDTLENHSENVALESPAKVIPTVLLILLSSSLSCTSFYFPSERNCELFTDL
jgi:hypothetical protein